MERNKLRGRLPLRIPFATKRAMKFHVMPLVSQIQRSTMIRPMRAGAAGVFLLALFAFFNRSFAQKPPSDLPYTFQSNVMARMRDGAQLAANVFLPKAGGPFPVILIRTPYGKMDEKFGEAK